MAIKILTIIFFAGGAIAILYSVLALLSMLKYSQTRKVLPEKFTPEAGKPETMGPPIVEAYCQRARILLQSHRFDAALADCKRAIDINPKHAEANILWKHALDRTPPPLPVAEPIAEAMPAPAEAEPAVKIDKKVTKRIKPRKKVVAKPVPAEEPVEAPAEEAVIIFEETAPEKELILEEKPKEAAAPPVEPVPDEPEEVAVAPEAVPEEAPHEPAPEVELTPEAAEPVVELKVEAEVEPVAEPEPVPAFEEEAEVAPEPLAEEKISVEEEPSPGLEPEEAEPATTLEAEAEVAPAISAEADSRS